MNDEDAIEGLRAALDVAEDVRNLLKPLAVKVSVRGVELDEEGCYIIVLRVCSSA